MVALSKNLGPEWKGEKIDYQYFLNASHLAGFGDALKAFKQKVEDGVAIDDYDLTEMLRDASVKVTTRKLLLVAHSQGNFYANSFYDKVTGKDTPPQSSPLKRGGSVPAESIGVYSVATPSDHVAGNGKYLTSGTDKVITDLVGSMPFFHILSPNDYIELHDGDDQMGHSFSDVYLKYKPAEIVSDIEWSLDKLTTSQEQNTTTPASGHPSSTEEGRPCIEPPALTALHKIEGAAFAVADPVANSGLAAVVGTVKAVNAVGLAVLHSTSFVGEKLASVFTAETGNAAAVAKSVADSTLTMTAENADSTQNAAMLAAAGAIQTTPQKEHTNKLENVGMSEGEKKEEQPPPPKTEAPPLVRGIHPPAHQNEPPPLLKENNPPGQPPLVSENNPPRQPPLVRGMSDPSQPASPYRLAPAGGGGGGVSNPQRVESEILNPSSLTTLTSTEASSSQAGGGGATTTATTTTPTTTPTNTLATTTPADTTAPDAPTITSPVNSSTALTTSVTFSGTAEAGAVIASDFSQATTSAAQTTSASQNSNGQAASGAWTLSLTLPQGTTTVQFYATDAAGNRSATTTQSVFVDSQSPDVTLTSSTCTNSLSSSGCLVATTTLAFSWSSAASDLAYFTINANGSISTTTATSTSATATDASTYTFIVSATDRAGNVSPTSTKSVSVFTAPVVINEIAWAGTAANSAHQWLELYNRTGETVSLSNWTLYAADLTPYVPLSGTLAPHAYYLIESTDSAVSDVAADLIFPLGMSQNGESLRLAFSQNNATSTVDTVATCIGGGTSWCSGYAPDFLTMERYSASVSGSDSSNWSSNLGEFIRNGDDSNGNILNGTPKAKNSISYLISLTNSVAANTTLTAANSPYLIPRQGLSVASGVTLRLEPGTVVKFAAPNDPALTVNGTLIANGTASQPVVFTALADDDYGGDTNGDGAATAPVAGSWRRILIGPTSTGSSLTYTLVRYGGGTNISDSTARQGALGVDTATASLDHVTVEHSALHGLGLENSNSTVTNSTFSDNTAYDVMFGVYGVGMDIAGGAPTVTGNTFSGNHFGLTIQSSTTTVTGNTFTDNAAEAFTVSGVLGSFSGNSGSGNGTNGIVLQSASSDNTGTGATTELRTNSLPYVLRGSLAVAANSTLLLDRGVVVKSIAGNSSGYIVVGSGGTLRTTGTSPSDVIFTSLYDSVGGVVASGYPQPSAGNWRGVIVNAGGRLDLSGFTLRYAGSHGMDVGDPEAGLYITGNAGAGSGSISNALFDTNYQNALSLVDVSSFSASNITVQNHLLSHVYTNRGTGIYGVDSTADFSNITFTNNSYDAAGVGVNHLTCTTCSSSNGALITDPNPLFGL